MEEKKRLDTALPEEEPAPYTPDPDALPGHP